MDGLSINFVVKSRSFALVELGCVLTCALLWFVWPGLSWAPLLVALFPWLLRLSVGRFPFRRTPFDLSLAVFLLTASVGVWAAYDRERAWAKFWLLVASVLLFYALTRQEENGLWKFAGFLSLFSALLAIYFLLTNDWQSQQTKIPLISQVGNWWMAVRPSLQAPAIHPNNAASIMAVMAPFSVATVIYNWKQGKTTWMILMAAATGLTFIGLMLSISRGALLSLSVVLGVSFLWVVSGVLARFLSWKRGLIFLLLIVPLVLLGSWMVSVFPGGAIRLLDRLPGPASASSRVEIARDTLQLISDFPFTGGGLRSFPGLYSQYLLVIPYFYIEYSHNLFLEVALEQGILGLVSLGIVLVISIGLFVSVLRARPGLLAWAGLASLAVMCLHGLVTDAVYGERGSPFVFFQAGMAVALAQPILGKPASRSGPERKVGMQNRDPGRIGWKIAGAVVTILILVALTVAFYRPLMSRWYSNLGAVEMSRVELANFPSSQWEDGEIVPSLDKAEALFNQSLQYQQNQTANYRLGLIASLRQDFHAAVAFLETAYWESPGHRGIQKNLGYNETWSGQLDQAEIILQQIPEAGEEMSVYAWWWGTKGRKDLAHNAEIMAERLRLKNQ